LLVPKPAKHARLRVTIPTAANVFIGDPQFRSRLPRDLYLKGTVDQIPEATIAVESTFPGDQERLTLVNLPMVA
jgi:hypothetical protein